VTEAPVQKLRVLSYNIQAGVDTQHYRHYLTQSWKHVLPHRERLLNLNRIATLLSEYDLVGLQEVDSGSLRSGFVDQTEYLAHRAGFPYWFQQVNRSLGKFAQHSNGLLSRQRPRRVIEYRLPGLPGRGAIFAHYGHEDGLVVVIMHLSLGKRARLRQMAYISERLQQYQHAIVMGDLNCSCDSREMRLLMDRAGLQEPSCEKSTFPSWRPMRKIDHILVSDSLGIQNPRVVNYPLSDHLPIGIDVLIPRGINLAA
jgi:endonuclease/exonuclease/phosphatase family metal-dependent hydrolase